MTGFEDTLHEDLARSGTLPGRFHASAAVFARLRERIFARSWQLVADLGPGGGLEAPGSVLPVTWLPGLFDEPLLAVRGRDGALAGLSNVCTHRGALLCERPAVGLRSLTCPYHARRFALDGRLLAAPGFEGAADFPRARDDLPRVSVERWGPFVFAALDPAVPFAQWIEPAERLLGWLPWSSARRHDDRTRDYSVAAHFALYLDNYLEGFHIPSVHPALAPALERDTYENRTFPTASVQVGFAPPGDGAPVLQPPPGHADHGRAVAGYYLFLWPNTALNVYPWGCSLNLVLPQSPTSTTVRYQGWVWDESALERGAGAGLHRVELEDEAIVASCQRGVTSRLYGSGRFAPRHEACVHHFHRLLAAALR